MHLIMHTQIYLGARRIVENGDQIREVFLICSMRRLGSCINQPSKLPYPETTRGKNTHTHSQEESSLRDVGGAGQQGGTKQLYIHFSHGLASAETTLNPFKQCAQTSLKGFLAVF